MALRLRRASVSTWAPASNMACPSLVRTHPAPISTEQAVICTKALKALAACGEFGSFAFKLAFPLGWPATPEGPEDMLAKDRPEVRRAGIFQGVSDAPFPNQPLEVPLVRPKAKSQFPQAQARVLLQVGFDEIRNALTACGNSDFSVIGPGHGFPHVVETLTGPNEEARCRRPTTND
jgi:hypothetical protein